MYVRVLIAHDAFACTPGTVVKRREKMRAFIVVIYSLIVPYGSNATLVHRRGFTVGPMSKRAVGLLNISVYDNRIRCSFARFPPKHRFSSTGIRCGLVSSTIDIDRLHRLLNLLRHVRPWKPDSIMCGLRSHDNPRLPTKYPYTSFGYKNNQTVDAIGRWSFVDGTTLLFSSLRPGRMHRNAKNPLKKSVL